MNIDDENPGLLTAELAEQMQVKRYKRYAYSFVGITVVVFAVLFPLTGGVGNLGYKMRAFFSKSSVPPAAQIAGSRKAFFEQTLVDSTGKSFQTIRQTFNLANDASGHLEPLIQAGNKIYAKSQLDQISKSGATVDQPAQGAQADANGVIVELTTPPALQERANKLSQGQSEVAADAAAKQRLSALTSEHNGIRKQIENKLNKPLSQLSSQEFKAALNGFAIKNVSVEEATQKLKTIPGVKRVVPNARVQADLLDSVPMITADQAWRSVNKLGNAIDGAGVRIGIIDTGIDYTHQDLGGCFGPGCKVEGGFDFSNNDADPMDDHGHGTHVAATAAGQGFNTSSTRGGLLLGVAPGATLYAYKVLDANGSGFFDTVIAGVERCADPNGDGSAADRLDICSMSLGGFGDPDDPLSQAVDNATANGVVFTVAAGNSGPSANTISTPGTARRAITVGAACKTADVGVDRFCPDAMASFSSRGPVMWTDSTGAKQTLAKPDVAAPGHKICAAEFDSWLSDRRCLDGKHIAISGTSMATPHVAGAAALLKQANPSLSPDQIKNILKSTAKNLGLDQYSQGAGLVDAQAAVSNSGANLASFIKLGGAPLVIIDTPQAAIGAYSKTLTITNPSSQTVTYTASADALPKGLSVTFTNTKSSLTVPGGNFPLSMTIKVDHKIVPSPSRLIGGIKITAGKEVARVPITILVQNRLLLDKDKLDFGVDFADQPTWTANQQIVATSTLLDASSTYTVSVVCCGQSGATTTAPIPPSGGGGGGGGGGLGFGGLTASVSPTNITLTPSGQAPNVQSGSAPVTVTLSAQNSSLPNGRYSGFLKFSSLLQTLIVPMTFYKGYGIQFNFAVNPPVNSPPLIIYLFHNSNAGFMQLFPAPDARSITALVNDPGPYFAENLWFDFPVISTHVFNENIQTNQPVVSVNVARADANHTLTFNPADINGQPLPPFGGGMSYNFTHRRSGNFSGVFTTGFGNGMQIKVSNLSSDFSFNGMASQGFDFSDLYAFAYQQLGGISTDVTYNTQPSDFVAKDLVGFPNRTPSQPVFAYTGLCGLRYSGGGFVYAIGCGYMSGTGSGMRTVLNSGSLKKLYSANYNAQDISASAFPDYPFFNLELSLSNDFIFDKALYRSPNFYISQPRMFSWLPGLSDGTYSFDLAHYYDAFKVETPPEPTLPLGNAPLFDAGRWYNLADIQIFLAPRAHFTEPMHLWGGYNDEFFNIFGSFGDQVEPSYTLTRDGAVVAQGKIPVGGALFAPYGPGNYQLKLARPATINGQVTKVATVSNFKVVTLASHEKNPTDENPPSLRSLHLLAYGAWQNVIDPAADNSLNFTLDPNPGLLGRALDGSFTLMSDALQSIKLEVNTDGGRNWTAAPTTPAGAGAFNAPITIVPGTTLYNFRVSAADTAGNTFSYTFALPTGTAVLPTDVQPPTVAITSPATGETVSGKVDVSVSAQDNVKVTGVKLYADDKLVDGLSVAPFIFSWDTSRTLAGEHQLYAKASDAAGHVTESARITVNVEALKSPPPGPKP